MATKDLTIEWQADYRFYALYEFGVYERGSLLAGQTRKTFIRDYNTLKKHRPRTRLPWWATVTLTILLTIFQRKGNHSV